MTPQEYGQRTAPMLLTFANEDVRRTVTTGNVVYVSRLPDRAPEPFCGAHSVRDVQENSRTSTCSLSPLGE